MCHILLECELRIQVVTNICDLNRDEPLTLMVSLSTCISQNVVYASVIY